MKRSQRLQTLAPAPQQAVVRPPIIPIGSIWAKVSARGRGISVKVTRVTPVNVQFRAFGKNVDMDRSTLAINAFITCYSLLGEIPARQENLRLLERQEILDLTDGQEALPEPDETEEDEIPMEAAAVEMMPEPEPSVRPSYNAYGSVPAETAREIYALKGSAVSHEVAETYDVPLNTVRDIWRGRSYAWATGAGPGQRRLLGGAEAGSGVAAMATPQPTRAEVRVPHSLSELSAPVINATFRTAEEVRAEESRKAQQQVRSTADVAFCTDVADALEMLLEYAGVAIPKFISLDRQRLGALIREARLRAGQE